MAINVETYFLVTVNTDGTFTTYAQLPEEPIEAAKQASNFDVFQTCKAITEEFEAQVSTDRIVRAVVAALMPEVPTTADTIKDALKERGIDPESKAPTA